ncbi:hypothetical protein [Actinomadura decatromicini]|uniref:Uncharacterized protein n=1 Tax=Actinomadura decatromicini TaxID=2604572 RepID=A0A5D3FB32_9ACTN|nr:hypothetical protein [Actinomadura decatromicini]TYK45114.1 hypothetical protein FXF68_31005 [Actinomadura decatromicini]
MTSATNTTVADIAACQFPDGTVVTVTATANWFAFHEAHRGGYEASFQLIDGTSVPARLTAREYRVLGADMGPTIKDCRPQRLTVTGRVAWVDDAPTVVVTDVERLASEPCESLETLRLQGLRSAATLRDRAS